jgi:hypothetical protein
MHDISTVFRGCGRGVFGRVNARPRAATMCAESRRFSAAGRAIIGLQTKQIRRSADRESHMGRIIPALAICAATFAVTPAAAQTGENGAALLVPPAPYDSETRPSAPLSQPPSPHIIPVPQPPEVLPPPQVTQAPEPQAATPVPEEQPVAQDKAPEPATTGGIDKKPEEKQPSEAAAATTPSVPADQPSGTTETTQNGAAEPKPAVEAEPQAAPEAKPSDTADAKPGEPEAKPADTVEAEPKAPAESQPAASAETKPESPAETKPSDTVEAKPNAPVETRPGTTADAKPTAPAETKQDGIAEAKPNETAEARQNGVAEAKPKDNADGRFTFSRMNDGYVRLDNRTGQVSFCGKRSVGWTCQLAPDDRGALENEIARLQEENVTLKRDLLGRGLPLPGTVKPEPQPRVSQNERAPFSLPHDPNIERMKVMVEKMWRQLVDMITSLQKDVLKKS